jgi:hypothetical protein
MKIEMWYWVILIIWIVLGGVGMFWEDSRIRRGGDLVLIVLLVLLGFMVAGGPVR